MKEKKLKVVTEENLLDEIREGDNFFECMGCIVNVDSASQSIYVDFKENPFKRPLKAVFAKPVSENQVNYAIKNKLPVKLEFLNGNRANPIIKDIYSSVFDKESPENIHIKGKTITFEGDEELIFKCGNINIRCSAENGEFRVSAEKIRMDAKGNNEITGTVIKLN